MTDQFDFKTPELKKIFELGQKLSKTKKVKTNEGMFLIMVDKTMNNLTFIGSLDARQQGIVGIRLTQGLEMVKKNLEKAVEKKEQLEEKASYIG